MANYPQWYLDISIQPQHVSKDGKNAEGLTWHEWYDAALFGGWNPRSCAEETWGLHAFACGVDPTEMGQS